MVDNRHIDSIQVVGMQKKKEHGSSKHYVSLLLESQIVKPIVKLGAHIKIALHIDILQHVSLLETGYCWRGEIRDQNSNFIEHGNNICHNLQTADMLY